MTTKHKRLALTGCAAVAAVGIGWRIFTHVTFPACLRPYADETEFVQRKAVWACLGSVGTMGRARTLGSATTTLLLRGSQELLHG